MGSGVGAGAGVAVSSETKVTRGVCAALIRTSECGALPGAAGVRPINPTFDDVTILGRRYTIPAKRIAVAITQPGEVVAANLVPHRRFGVLAGVSKGRV